VYLEHEEWFESEGGRTGFRIVEDKDEDLRAPELILESKLSRRFDFGPYSEGKAVPEGEDSLARITPESLPTRKDVKALEKTTKKTTPEVNHQ